MSKRDVAEADLVAAGDGFPHEYLHADTGANRGFPLQSWDASLFLAIFTTLTKLSYNKTLHSPCLARPGDWLSDFSGKFPGQQWRRHR